MSMPYTIEKSPAQRYGGVAVVVALHVAVGWMLASGFGKSVIQVMSAPIETKVIEEVAPPEELPPPPPPLDLEAPPPEFVPPPEIALAPEPVAPTNAIRQVQSKVVTKPAPAAVAIVPPRSDPRHTNALPPYPPAARRLGEEGAVTLQLYINKHGRVEEARVQSTSGFPRLDQAAVREAKRKWRFVPANEGGRPIAAWMSIVVRFQLTQ